MFRVDVSKNISAFFFRPSDPKKWDLLKGVSKDRVTLIVVVRQKKKSKEDWT